MPAKKISTMMMRTAMTLFVSALTIISPTSKAWAQEEEEEEGIVYYDPTAPEGEQMKRTIVFSILSEDTFEDNSVLEEGWYYVEDDLQVVNRITVNGTVNIILGDGCTLEVQKGIEVPEGKTLNIYAQSAGDDKGSLVAFVGEGGEYHQGRDAAIGGDGGDDGYNDGMKAGNINIYGGNIEAHGNIGGGNGGDILQDEDMEDDESRGGDGGDIGQITIYGGNVSAEGCIGGGRGGVNKNTEEEGEDGYGEIYLSWSDLSDRIHAYSFNGDVTFQKEFVNKGNEDDEYIGHYWGDEIYDDITLIPLYIPKYTISLEGYNIPCLGITPNPAKEDEEIELLVVNGYNVTSVSVTTEDGDDVEVNINEDYEDGDVWSFIMPAQNVIVSAVATREKFFIRWDQNEGIDIDEADWDNLYTPDSTINFTVDVEDYLQLQSAYYCYTDNDGYHEEYCNISSDGICSFVMPAHDVTLKTTRQQIAFNIHYDTNKMKVSSDPVVIDEDYYKTGSKVTVSTVSIPDGLIIKSFKVTQADNTAVSYTDNGNGSYTFLMPSSDVTIHVIYGTDDMTLLLGPTAFTVTKGVIWGVEGSDYFKEYTIGNEDEDQGPTYLLDGKYTENNDSKWCVDFGDENKDHPCYVEFHTTKPVVPKKYVLITGNDNLKCNGRNPRDWKIKAKNEGDTNWTVIAEVNNDETLKDVNFTPYTFDFNNASDKAYQYFRFEITANAGSEYMQLEEMMMWVKDKAASGVATGIENMEHSPSAIDHYYYDLQGRRVEHPTKGLYIVNGRKVVVE
jgi:hypothetical protein